MVESLLPLECHNPGRTTLDRLTDFIDVMTPEYARILCVVFIEMLVELCSADIVYGVTKDGMSFLDKARTKSINTKKWIHIFTKLLSVCEHDSVENQVSQNKLGFTEIFIEAIERGYGQLVEDLLKLKDYVQPLTPDACLDAARWAVHRGYLECLGNMLDVLKKKDGNELQQDKHGKTLFHYGAESGNREVLKLLFAEYRDEYREKKRDKWERTFLHWAALNGESDVCQDCIANWQLRVDDKDCLGQNSLHFSAKGNKGELVVDILIKASSRDLIYARDNEGRTPLHLASAKGKLMMVRKLLSFCGEEPFEARKYIEQIDGFGRTVLHMAAGGGHTRVVQLLLEKDCDPLKQRDIHGNTALHYAAKVKDVEVAETILQSLLNKYTDRSDLRSLLLWASATGIRTAEEAENVHPDVKDFLLQEKARYNDHLLQAATANNNVEMAWELLNRGAKITDINDHKWRTSLSDMEIKNVENVLKQIEITKEYGQDKPSPEDNLGRGVLAEGLAALFLNRFIESPITVGISGEWGMGKSSLMIQTENTLLMAASQLSFPNLLLSEKFVGAEKVSLSKNGKNIYRKMRKAMRKVIAGPKKYRMNNPIVELLNKYNPQYRGIYKSLALMDLQNQMLSSKMEIASQFQAMRGIPRVLTIRYNAWHYRNEHEAWAGLAVTITKEIEQAMTRAQWFSTCWRYSWIQNRVNIYIQIILPCLLATFIASWVAWAAWSLLRNAKFSDLKYGSIPCTVIAIAWAVLQSIVSAVKPVSTQMMGYIISPDHTARLGYQEQVICDINFLKGELGKKPHWFFSFISGEWCWNWFGLHPDNVENTCIPKFSPACEDQLRIITFVDDLDRCDEKVILQVLSAINLILAECKINVILGIDKKMIQRAVERHFGNNYDRDLADKFICKIIQIPLSLSDPTDDESEKFLLCHLRNQPPTRTEIKIEDGEDTDYGDLDTDNDVEEIGLDSPRQDKAIDIDFYGPSTNSQGIIKKGLHLIGCIFDQILCLLACNPLRGGGNTYDALKENEIHPLTFSKAARLTKEMLQLTYTAEESEILYRLKGFTTGSQRLPREWKRFLDYRKFAANILSMVGKVYILPNWKTQLVVWIFTCWQWKQEMNTLIKGWHKYAAVKSKGRSIQSKDEGKMYSGNPSLKQIVKNYITESHESRESLNKIRKLSNEMIETEKDFMKLKEYSGEDSSIQGNLFMRDQDIKIVDEGESTYFNWLNLLEALEVQDVSMKGIQLFQQFRLHCETDSIPWPLPESYVHKYNRLMTT